MNSDGGALVTDRTPQPGVKMRSGKCLSEGSPGARHLDGSATPPAQVLQLKVIADSPIKRPSHVDAQFALDPEREGGDIRCH